ncbi:helix-turn-helix domain-containing protein [Emticicia sp. W12TSBA100-4]|uniref:helix-turn-helix domain-containing protein n=1 Tax=Emticicia sp. W12TSBA100-4 TaxID=3160965 RepID=UPI0033062958
MENTNNKLPRNRDELANRYGISKKTLYRWFKRSKIEKDIPEIYKISCFNINQANIIVKKFG